MEAKRRSLFERFRVFAPWGPSMVFFSRRSWRDRGSEALEVLTDMSDRHWFGYWFGWAIATVVGIPSSLVVLAFEPGDTVRIGGLGLLIVCVSVFWVGLKALDRRLNDQLAEELAASRGRQQP